VETTVTFSKESSIENLRERAFTHNAQYLATEEKLVQSQLSLKLVQSSQMPRLDLNSSYTYAATRGGWHLGLKDAGQTFRLGASLSFNLFNGFQTAILKANSRILLKTEELTLKQSRLELEKSIISASESYQNSLEILELEKQYLEAAEINFKRMTELYRLGQVTSTQFREAQLNLIRARTNLASAKYDAKMMDLELLRITGQLVRPAADAPESGGF
jgi:outer membrane protein